MDGVEIRRRAFRGVVSIGLRGVGIRILGLIGYLVTARLLTPGDFGLAALGLTLTFAAHYLADGGIGLALIRVPETPDRRDYAAVEGLQLVIMTTVLLVAVAWTAVARTELAVVSTLFVASLPMLAFRVPAAIALEREMVFGPSIRSDLSEVLVYNACIVVGAACGLGVYSLAIGAVVKTVVGTVVLNHYAPVGWIRPSLEFSRVKPYLKYGLRFVAAGGVNMGKDQLVNFGTLAVAGYGPLGLFTIAARVITVPTLLFESIGRVSLPAMTKLLASKEDLVRPMEDQTRRASVLAGLVLAPWAIAGPTLLPLVLGNKWDEAGGVVPVVMLGIVLTGPLGTVANSFLLAVGDATATLRANIVILVVQSSLNVILLLTVGYIGMGLAVLCALMADAAFLSRAVGRHSRARLLRCAVPGALAFVPSAVLGVLLSFGDPSPPVAILGTLAAPLSFLALVYTADAEAVRELTRLARELPRRLREPAVAVPSA